MLAEIDQAHTLLEPAAGADGPSTAVNDQRTCDPWQLNLPPLPAQLHEQAAAIHERQLELVARLQDAMNAIRLQQSVLDAPAPPRSSLFVDQRV